MFKIGEFSRLAQVTIDTLRHYDAKGLLKPASIDPFTGYRLYSARQLRPLNTILTLKELGFSLDEIRQITQESLTTAELRGMLKGQLAAAESEKQAVEVRIAKIQARLQTFNSEDNQMTHQVILKAVEAHTIAEIREVVPTAEQMPERCGVLFDTIAQWMVSAQLPFGAAMTTYYDESHTRENIDMGCAFIIPDSDLAAQASAPEAPIRLRQIAPQPEVAVTIVSEDFHKKVDGLTPAYHALGEWIEANGYRVNGPQRELFHGTPNSENFAAEIQFPVVKASVNS